MSNNAVDSTRAINALLQKKNFIKLPDITGQSLIDCHTISSIESTMWSIIDQYCKIVINEKAGVESTKEIGGCLCMLSRHRKEVLMMPNPIGYFPGISRTDYDLESLGNAIQLHEGRQKNLQRRTQNRTCHSLFFRTTEKFRRHNNSFSASCMQRLDDHKSVP